MGFVKDELEGSTTGPGAGCLVILLLAALAHAACATEQAEARSLSAHGLRTSTCRGVLVRNIWKQTRPLCGKVAMSGVASGDEEIAGA